MMDQKRMLDFIQSRLLFINKQLDTRFLMVLLLALVFLLRLSLSTAMVNSSGMDADGYWWLGRRIAKGGDYTFFDGTPTARRTPIPVFFYATAYKLFGQNRLAVLSLLWLLDVGTAWLIYMIAKNLFKSREVALLAVLVFALYLPEIRYTTRTHSEPIGTFLLACFVLSLLKARQYLAAVWFAVAGVLLGLAILTRPFLAAFPAVALLIMASWPVLRSSPKKLLIRALVFTMSVTITLTPWFIRNYLVFEAFVPISTLGSFNLYKDHWRLAETDYVKTLDVGWRFIDPESKAELIAQGVNFIEWNGREFPDWSEPEYDHFYFGKALEIIQQYPGRYLHLSFLRVLRLWFNVGYGTPPSIESYMVLAANFVLFLLATTAYFVSGPQRKDVVLLWILPIYATLLHVPIHALVRYFIPVMPYILILASFTIIELGQSLRGLNVEEKEGQKIQHRPLHS